MIWLLIFLWLIGSLFIGFPLGLLALRNESRLSVLFAYGIVAGLCLQSLLLILLWGAVPLGTAVHLVLAISLSVGALLLWRLAPWQAFSRFIWGMSRPSTVLSLTLVTLYALLGHRTFTVAYTAGDNEARYRHSGLVAWLSRGLFPPTNPLEPNDPLHYRLGLHALAAGISSASNSLPPEALAATIAFLIPLAVLALVGASLRVFDRAGPGILASVLGLFGGTLLPYYNLIEALKSPNSDLKPIDLVNGLLWHGNTLDMLHINPTIAIGFAVFAAALWLCWETARSYFPSLGPFLIAVVALAYLGLVNEIYFAALAMGSVAAGVLQSVVGMRAREPRWWVTSLQNLALFAVSFGIVSIRGGVLGGVSLTGGDAGAIRLTLNLDHLGSLVSPPRQPEVYWVPLLSVVGQLDTDFAFLVLPALVLMAWWARRSYVTIGLLAASPVLVVWATVYPGYRPNDAYRFGQAALTIYLTLMPFALNSTPRLRELLSTRSGHLITTIGIVALTVPHLFFATWLLVSPPRQAFLRPDSPDTLAAEYLRLSGTTYRVLVPDKNPAGGWQDLYLNYDFHITAGTILALSGHAVPMGDQSGPFNPRVYVEKYRIASTTFDPAAMEALKIDWVYVAPSQLDADQLEYLRSAQDEGYLKLDKSFGEHGTPSERLLFRFRPPQTGP